VGRVELQSLQLQAAADSAAAKYQRTVNLTTARNAANAELASYASLNGITAPRSAFTLGASSGYFKGGALWIPAPRVSKCLVERFAMSFW
jgi:hypothetical protein